MTPLALLSVVVYGITEAVYLNTMLAILEFDSYLFQFVITDNRRNLPIIIIGE